MANVEHLKILVEGVKFWNKEREKLNFNPDLSHIEIRNSDFRDANFDNTDFDGSSFHNVNLKNGSFKSAKLNGIQASYTSFLGANFEGAEFKGADLKYVNLKNANFKSAKSLDLKIRHSNMENSTFKEAELKFSHFYNSSLKGVNFQKADIQSLGLKRVKIEGSELRLLKSKNCFIELLNKPNTEEWLNWKNFKIEELSDEFSHIISGAIAYWVKNEKWDFFISHSSTVKITVAKPLAKAFQNLGYKVWYDDFEIKPGDNLSDIITFGIKSSVFGIIIISKNFFGRQCTEFELEALLNKRIFLVLHDVTPEELMRINPDLNNRFNISSKIGIKMVADKILEASRRPPRKLNL